MTITVKRELDFNDLFNECWSGAVDTLRTISENDKEEELMSLLALDCFCGNEIPDLTDVNDLLWFDSEWIFEQLGIDTDSDDDDDDDDDDMGDDDDD